MSGPPHIASRRIILVRHGHYLREGALGDTVWGLSPLGHRQAARTGRRLALQLDPRDRSFEGIFTSAWPRARQTAEVIAHELDAPAVRVKPYLHELVPLIDPRAAVSPEGLAPTTGEDERRVERKLERVRERFLRTPTTDTTAVVVTHGNLIRYLMLGVLGLPYYAWTSLDIGHCSVTEVRLFASGSEVLVCFNDTGHLPPDMVTNT